MAMNLSTSSFKRFGLRFLLPVGGTLAVLLLAADWLITKQVVQQYHSMGAYKTHRLFSELHPDEIPVFGSSRASGSYVPELIHPQCFNYGIENTQFRLASIFLEEELRKNKETPIIVNFDYEFFRKRAGNIAHFIPNLHHDSIRSYVDTNYRMFYSIPGLRYYGIHDDYAKSWLAEHSDKNHLSRGGFFLKAPTDPAAFAQMADKRRRTSNGWDAPANLVKRWEKLLNSTKRPIFIVVAPYHESCFERFNNMEAAQKYLARMDALPHVTVLDYGQVDYPDAYFMNTTHLNYEGAQVFSKELSNAINNHINQPVN